jgi:mannose-1-phosphate guanylyltransferase
MKSNKNLIVGLLAREEKGKSSARIGIAYKTCEFRVPVDIKTLEPSKFKSPINYSKYPHILEVTSKVQNGDKQYLLATEKVIEKAKRLNLPFETINTGVTGTGSATIALLLKSKSPNDIIGISPCDQLQTKNIKLAIKRGIKRMKNGEINCFTIVVKSKKFIPSLGHISYDHNKRAKYFVKKYSNHVNKEFKKAGGDTMIVYFKHNFLKKKMKQAIHNNHPQSEIIKKHLELINKNVDIHEFFKLTPYSDFSSLYHPLLISEMGVEIVQYGVDWDDWGTWRKIYNSPYVPKDENENVIFSSSDNYYIKNVKKSIIVNFLKKPFILKDLKEKVIALGERGLIIYPLDHKTKNLGKIVTKINM